MRIGLNALLYSGGTSYRQTGVSRYIDQLLGALSELAVDDELIAYVDRDARPERWLSVTLRRTPFSIRRPATRIAWENMVLPARSRRDRVSVYHGMVNTLPFGAAGRQVVTVHDLAFIRYPEQITTKRYQYLKRMIGSSVKRADAVLTPSESSRKDVIEMLGADPDRVHTTPLGVDSRFRPRSPRAVSETRTKLGQDSPYVLCVGTIEPRKNLPRLVRAFSEIAPRVPHDLVFVGPKGWLMDDIRQQIDRSGLGDRVRRLGFVDDSELISLYSGADVVAIPSLYEGFGLPVLEAMACGAPVLTSKSSSMPEVAGDAAILVDPYSVESIAAGLEELLLDESLRSRLSAKSIERAACFTWRRTAEATLAAYRDVVR